MACAGLKIGSEEITIKQRDLAISARFDYDIRSIALEGETRRASWRCVLGDIAPDFDQRLERQAAIHFHEWLGNSWGVLFSHPADFTPVCTTELGMTAKLKDEFAKRNVKIIALQRRPGRIAQEVDRRHQRHAEDHASTSRSSPTPIAKVSTLYDMIHPNANDDADGALGVHHRSDEEDPTDRSPTRRRTGRNFDEILRVIDSMQLTDKHSVATPVNWKNGDDVVIVPALQDPEVIKQKFPKGYTALRPYLRMTPQPDRSSADAAIARSSPREPGSRPDRAQRPFYCVSGFPPSRAAAARRANAEISADRLSRRQRSPRDSGSVNRRYARSAGACRSSAVRRA